MNSIIIIFNIGPTDPPQKEIKLNISHLQEIWLYWRKQN